LAEVFEEDVKEKVGVQPLKSWGATKEERYATFWEGPPEIYGAEVDNCAWCVRAGYEFVALRNDEWFGKSPSGGYGACCIPGDYNQYTSCDMTGSDFVNSYDPLDQARLLDDSYSTKQFASADLALLACPIDELPGDQYCGGHPKVVEIGSLAKHKGTGIKRSYTWELDACDTHGEWGSYQAWYSCSIVIKSECGAPTFDVNMEESVVAAGTDISELWELEYLEYSQYTNEAGDAEDFPPADLEFKHEDLTVDQSLFKGGMLYDLSVWYKGNTNQELHSMRTPAQLLLDWMAPSIKETAAYEEYIKEGGAYQLLTLFWNIAYAPEAAGALFSTDGGLDGLPEGPTQEYLDENVPWKLQEDGTRYYEAEKPAVVAPEPYSGPRYSTVAKENSFSVTSGYGKPAAGLWVPGQGGKSYGVRGQGNKKKDDLLEELPLSDQQYSLRWPPQPKSKVGCTPSFLALTVWRGRKAGDQSNKLVIEFRDSAWRDDVDLDGVKDASPAPVVLGREGLAAQLTVSVMAALSAIALVLA
jgi:hypothetical protein